MRVCSFVSLPNNFRKQDVLLFFGRDQQQTSERITENSLQKAFMMDGVCAFLDVSFGSKRASFTFDLDTEDVSSRKLAKSARSIVKHVLGLNQPVEMMESKYRKHSVVGKLLKQNAGLRVPQTVTVWEALISAVIGQQVSVSAATSMRVKFIKELGYRHSSGLNCFPGPSDVLRTKISRLRKCGLSSQKSATINEVAHRVSEGGLTLEASRDCFDYDDLSSRLIEIKGIGWWTINYTFLRGYAYLDGSLHGDAAVRRNLQQLMALPEPIDAAEVERFLCQFSPYRALIAAHLWALQRSDGY
jgi:DNA-3-methyladenine glycosylase II